MLYFLPLKSGKLLPLPSFMEWNRMGSGIRIEWNGMELNDMEGI